MVIFLVKENESSSSIAFKSYNTFSSSFSLKNICLPYARFPFCASGDYGKDVGLEKLKDFHRRKLQVLVDACPDLLAFETIPNKLEAQVCYSSFLPSCVMRMC